MGRFTGLPGPCRGSGSSRRTAGGSQNALRQGRRHHYLSTHRGLVNGVDGCADSSQHAALRGCPGHGPCVGPSGLPQDTDSSTGLCGVDDAPESNGIRCGISGSVVRAPNRRGGSSERSCLAPWRRCWHIRRIRRLHPKQYPQLVGEVTAAPPTAAASSPARPPKAPSPAPSR